MMLLHYRRHILSGFLRYVFPIQLPQHLIRNGYTFIFHAQKKVRRESTQFGDAVNWDKYTKNCDAGYCRESLDSQRGLTKRHWVVREGKKMEYNYISLPIYFTDGVNCLQRPLQYHYCAEMSPPVQVRFWIQLGSMSMRLYLNRFLGDRKPATPLEIKTLWIG